MKNYVLVLFMSVFAFAAMAKSPAETALAHSAYEQELDAGNDAFLEPIAVGENDASVGLTGVDAEEALSTLMKEDVECNLYIEVYEWSWSIEWEGDGVGYSLEGRGYEVNLYLECY